MKVSDAISKLQDILGKYGDLELRVESQKHLITDIFFCRDEDMLHDNWVQIDAPGIRPAARFHDNQHSPTVLDDY